MNMTSQYEAADVMVRFAPHPTVRGASIVETVEPVPPRRVGSSQAAKQKRKAQRLARRKNR